MTARDEAAPDGSESAATAQDLVAGAVVRVPAGAYRDGSGPFLLEVTSREPREKAAFDTGYVHLWGYVLPLSGATTRKRRLYRSVVVRPGRVTIVRRAPPA